MGKHVGDLLAALMQICFSKADQSDSAMQPASQSKSLTQPTGNSRDWFRHQLEELITRSYAPLIVRELLTLQASGGKKVVGIIKTLHNASVTFVLSGRSSQYLN